MQPVKGMLNLVLLCVPAMIAGLASARLSRSSRDEWEILAWVPPLPLLAFGLYVGILQMRDPTAANLWPFAMVFFMAVTGALFGLFIVARKLLCRVSNPSRSPGDRQ